MKIQAFKKALRHDGFKVIELMSKVEIHCGQCASAWEVPKSAIRKPSFHHLHLLNHLYSHKAR